MEFVLRDEKNELAIDHQEGRIGFTVLLVGGDQLNFGADINEWNHLKRYIEDSISDYESKKWKAGK